MIIKKSINHLELYKEVKFLSILVNIYIFNIHSNQW